MSGITHPDFVRHRMNLALALGKTFSRSLAFTDGTPVYKPITAVTAGAPTVLTVTGHGLPNGWPFLIEGAQGMTALNRREAWSATVVDANTVRIADLNSRTFDPYVADSGVIHYSQPADLTDRAGVLSARRDANSTEVLFTLSGTQINIDAANSRVTLQASAVETAALIPTLKGLDQVVYDLELPTSAGLVDLWTFGDIQILRDV